jgi:hypothetical protein
MKNQSYENTRKMYEGKRFRYNSKYGSSTENILCYRVVICEAMKLVKLVKKDWTPCPAEIIIVSDKGNCYPLEEVEFYD